MRRLSCFIAAAAFAAAFAAPASAGDGRDRVYADSFGNLVIHSSAGYKRIIVGMGEVAHSYNLTGSYYEPADPQVVYLDEDRASPQVRRCSRPPHVWHGRAHMYGLKDGEIPQAPLVCE